MVPSARDMPRFVAVGHVTRDLTDDGWTPGGSALYASLTAARMDLKAGMVTSFGPDFNPGDLLERIAVSLKPSSVTTAFRNIYDSPRTQRIYSQAEVLTPEIVPQSWRAPDALLICPVINEVDPSMLDLFAPTISGVMPQGWLRRWDAEGNVSAGPWDNRAEIRGKVDLLFLSREDLTAGEEQDPKAYADIAKIVIITRGREGSLLHFRGRTINVPSRFAKEADPTGAGDVFAASFLIKYLETGNPVHAANHASIAAAISVEAVGTSGIPDRLAVDERMHHG